MQLIGKFVLLAGSLVLGMASLASAQAITDACEYLPLCSGNTWTTTGDVETECGQRNSLGRMGTALCYPDGGEDIWLCDSNGIGLLEFSGPEEGLCTSRRVVFENPIVLIPEGLQEGQSTDSTSVLQIDCDGDVSSGSASWSVEFVESLASLTVPAGTFNDVIHMRVQGALFVSGENSPIDTEFYFARNVGLVREVDHVEDSVDELLNASVCGATYPAATPTPTPANNKTITDACAYWPMCPGNIWTSDEDSRYECGTQTSLGRQGTGICYTDGSLDIWRCASGVLELLELQESNDLCDLMRITFIDPVPLIIEGMNEGEKQNFSTQISADCDGETFSGSGSGSVEFIEALETYTVPAGTFSDVIRVRIRATLSAAGESLKFDVEFYFARDVGPIREIDREENFDEKLVSASVCGVNYPIPTPTPTPEVTATPTPTQGAAPGTWEELFDLSLQWDGTTVSPSNVFELLDRWHP